MRSSDELETTLGGGWAPKLHSAAAEQDRQAGVKLRAELHHLLSKGCAPAAYMCDMPRTYRHTVLLMPPHRPLSVVTATVTFFSTSASDAHPTANCSVLVPGSVAYQQVHLLDAS